MTLTRLEWADGGQDFHLLPGLTSPAFNALILAVDVNPATGTVTRKPLSERGDITSQFSVQIAGTLASHGLAIDAAGAVTVLPAVPDATKEHSFLVTATATQGTLQFTAGVRVHVHEALHSLWLTPFLLTARLRATGVRLSVLAQFTDGVIADISNWSPPPTYRIGNRSFVHAADPKVPVLSWKPEDAAGPVGVDPVTGVLEAKTADGTAGILVEGLGLLGQANVSCGPPWTTPVVVDRVAGPGFDAMNSVPNLLFLPDGFAHGEQEEFRKQVRRVVTRLTGRNRTRPFGVQGFPINMKLNAFMAWLPSNDAGVSVLNELYRVGQRADGTQTRTGIEPAGAQRPDPTAQLWTLPQIINEVGLPTPAGPFSFKPLDTRVLAWSALYGPQVTRTKVLQLDATWLARRDRVLLNEADTAFHLAFGERPAADLTAAEQALSFHPRRMDEGAFDTFLDALMEPPKPGFPNGRSLRGVWSTGKDSNLIVILARSLCKGGANNSFRRPSGSTIGVSLAPGANHRVKRNDAKLGWDLFAEPFPADPHHHVWMATAHELGHSCGLGEEYADLPGPPTAAMLDYAATSPNNQVRAPLLDTAGRLRADNIRWRHWPRIAKASALFAAPRPLTPGRFALSIEVRPRPGFARGDVVRLRTRPLGQSTTSGRFLVDSVTPDGLRLEVVALPGTVADPAQFPAGSIVMAPVRARDPEPAANRFGDDLGMVTDAVVARIDGTHNPLNAWPMAGESPPPNDPANRPCPGVTLPVPTAASNFPAGAAPAKPLFSAWTIGLYENAAHYRCGIYRPTGVCIMGTEAQKIGKDNFLYEFCQVCRYAIVDALFPTAHADVEIDYHSRYGR